MTVNIKPSTLCGTVTAPPSKSESHRALICAALSGSAVQNVNLCDDVKYTIDALISLGAVARTGGNTVTFQKLQISDIKSTAVFVGESGSTLRFLIPLVLLSGKEVTFKGAPSLIKRPLDVYEDICRENNFTFIKTEDSLTVCGRLSGGNLKVSGQKSSQFLSGLLLFAALGNYKIELTDTLKSAPYVDITVDILKKFGIEVKCEDNVYQAVGSYKKTDFTVGGDATAAAYLEAFSRFTDSVKVMGVSPDTKQGDISYKSLFAKMKEGQCEFDISDCPDISPVLFALSAIRGGEYRFSGAARLRYKESDRAKEMIKLLNKFGVSAHICDDIFYIDSNGIAVPKSPIDFSGDHRIIMAATLLLSVTGGVLQNAEAVKKSYEIFFDDLKQLGLSFFMC